MRNFIKRLLALKSAIFVRPTVRTAYVWAALALAMLGTTGLLGALEPPPLAPGSLQPVSSSIPGSGTDAVLFNTLPQVRSGRWNALVIHFSGQPRGTMTTISQIQADKGKVDSGYHFIINNGNGMPDGEIERGFRWQRQFPGEFGRGPQAEWFNQHALGICMVGNPNQTPPTAMQMRELTWLVRLLQERFNIPAERVIVQSDGPEPFKFFPASDFRAQLMQAQPVWVAVSDPVAPAAPAPAQSVPQMPQPAQPVRQVSGR
jgi:hypothetical protein